MTINDTPQQIRILVQAAAQACEDKKGEDTRILELDSIDAGLSDFFLVTSASNNRQSRTRAPPVPGPRKSFRKKPRLPCQDQPLLNGQIRTDKKGVRRSERPF